MNELIFLVILTAAFLAFLFCIDAKEERWTRHKIDILMSYLKSGNIRVDRPFAWLPKRKHGRDIDEVVRELLRFELSVGSYLEGYAYNVGPFGTKVALASKYYLAQRARFDDFWDFVPLSRDVEAPLSIGDDEKRVRDGKCLFALVDDGRSKTYVPAGPGIIVPPGYECSRATPEEVVKVIHNAQKEAADGYAERHPLDNV